MRNLRRHVTGLLVLLLLAPWAAGDETAPVLDVRNFDLLPLNDLERGEFARDHPDLARRVMVLAQRVETLRKHRSERADPNDVGGRRLGEQIAHLETELAPLVKEAVDACRATGIDDRLLAHVALAPRGPHRVARYAMGLVAYVEGIPEPSGKLLASVLPRIDGALVALHAQRERLEREARSADMEEARRAALLAACDQQVQAIERRWWLLVDYVVPQAPRAAIHRVLPRAYQKSESILQHLFALPGLETPQAARLRSVLEEVQAQAAPDQAAVQRLQSAAGDGASPASDNAARQVELQAAQGRLLGLQRWAVEQARRILDASQWEALEAIPPRVSFQDRRMTSIDLLVGVDLDPAQRARLGALRQELSGQRAEYRERRIKTAARGVMYGPDSPQMAGMQMEMANIEGEGNRIQRQFNGRILLDLLTAEQVAAWVLAPPPGR